MDKTLRNVLISIVATTILAFTGAWIQLNSRISVLEVQVNNDHSIFSENQNKTDQQNKELMNKVEDIRIMVTRLNDLKQNKE